MRILFLYCLSGILATAIYTSCSESGGGGPDMGPVGDGLSMIGICFVIGVLLLVLNRNS